MKTIDDTLRDIKRMNYRFQVKQNGGRFITVLDEEDLKRKAEFEQNMYDREMGYSGYDEYDEDGRPV